MKNIEAEFLDDYAGLGEMNGQTPITVREAYLAVQFFLVRYFDETKYDGFPELLTEMALLPDGTSMDPATWGQWIDAVEKALADRESWPEAWRREG